MKTSGAVIEEPTRHEIGNVARSIEWAEKHCEQFVRMPVTVARGLLPKPGSQKVRELEAAKNHAEAEMRSAKVHARRMELRYILAANLLEGRGMTRREVIEKTEV